MPKSKESQSSRPRAREAGVVLGTMPPGLNNAITDVPGVRVGHSTVIEGDGPLEPGVGPIRAGVTMIEPHPRSLIEEKVPAGIFVLNGFGKCYGQEDIDEFGALWGPIALTTTMNVALVADAILQYQFDIDPTASVTTPTWSPFVGECSGAFLNDMQGRHIGYPHVKEAMEALAAGPVAEGNVGGGTPMSLFGMKGGIGTASRRLPTELGEYTVGVLIQGNFGGMSQLTIAGAPVGRVLAERQEAEEPPERGSCMVIIATDAPLLDRALRRVAKRASLGLARTGSIAGNGSGDYVLAFSTGIALTSPAKSEIVSVPQVADWSIGSETINALFKATVEATEEAVINALFKAEKMIGRDSNVREALPIDTTLEILDSYGVEIVTSESAATTSMNRGTGL